MKYTVGTPDSDSDLTDLEDLVKTEQPPEMIIARTEMTAQSLVRKTRQSSGSHTKQSMATEAGGESAPANLPSKRRGKAQPKPKPSKKKALQSLDIPHPTPERWDEVYQLITEMREHEIAPVDTMGCQIAGKDETDPKNARLACLISLILSPQTTDEVCSAAVGKLRQALGGSISLQAILDADMKVILNSIKSVGFWTKKAGYLRSACQMIRNDFNGDVPQNAADLCQLPGVGPKVAFLTLQNAWDINTGIGVDLHVERITNRLGWHHPPTVKIGKDGKEKGDPEKARMNLESWLPREKWANINHMMVGFGQLICTKKARRCDQCVLSSKGLCPSAQTVETTTKKTRAVKVTKTTDEVKVEVTSQSRTGASLTGGVNLGAHVNGDDR